MNHLTDRMAAALRDELQRHESFIRSEYEGTSLLAEKLAESDASRAVLAEYDAQRNPPMPAKITAGSHVRCTRASRKTRDYQVGDEAKVQYLTNEGRAFVYWLTDLGNPTFRPPRSPFLDLDHCELVLNLPAVNTGD